MSTTLFRVSSGTTSPVAPILANQSLCVAPQLQGGSASILVSSNPSGPFASVAGSLTTGQSYRPDVNQYFQIQATTQNAVGVLSDMAIPSMQGELINNGVTIDSANSTAEQILFSFRLAPNTLPANFRCQVKCSANMTNSANAKNMNCRMNGLTGNLFFSAPSLVNVANYNFEAAFIGLGDGATLEGFGAGQTGWYGTSATVYTTLLRAYQQLETEIVVTAQKATGTETMQLTSILVNLQ